MDNLARNAAAATAVEGKTSGGSCNTGSDGEALVEALLSIEAIDGVSSLEQADLLLSSTVGVSGESFRAEADDKIADLAAEDAVYQALGRGIVEARNRLSSMSPEQRRRVGAARLTAKVQASGTGAGITGATRKRWDQTLSNQISPPVNASKSSKLKGVSSKIGGQVRSDRKNFRYNQSQYNDAALKSVAHNKVDVIVGGRGKRGGMSLPEDTDLTSGSAAMHIADAFLRGPVGSSLAELESEADFNLQHQEFLNRSIPTERGDMQRAIEEVDFLLSAGDFKLHAPAMLNEKELRYNAASEAARQQREDNEDRRQRRGVETQPELPSGWESKNGGFVADFNTTQGSAHFRR